ncbi:hypothetical protein BH23VER1_BH23VER1_18120 [soil metagenome]
MNLRLPRPATLAAYYLPLLGVAVACVAYLLTADEPPSSFSERLAERVADGKPIPIRWHMVIGLWWGAAFNALVCAGLLVLGPWITRPVSTRHPYRRPPGTRWPILLSVAAAMAYSGVANAPRLSHGLWGDEETTLLKAVFGEFSSDGGGGLSFEPRPWHDTLFNYKSTNNHVLYSVAARLSMGQFSPAPDSSDPAAPYFSEAAMRLPAFVAGLAALPALAWFVGMLGFRRAAALAPWLLALHPWFVRYQTEARGYGLVLVLAPLALALLLGALRHLRWRWWLGYAATQFALFWAYPGSIYLLVSFNLAALIYMVVAERRAIWRWLLANALSTMAVVAVMAPLVWQYRLYAATSVHVGGVGASWFADAIAALATGTPWHPPDPQNPLAISWGRMASESPVEAGVAGAVFVGLLALLGVGAARLVRRAEVGWAMALALLLPPALVFAHAPVASVYIYPWYLVTALPSLAAVLAVGLAGLTRHSVVTLAVEVLLGIGFVWATSPMRRLLRDHVVEPSREAVALTREITNPYHPDYNRDVITVSFIQESRTYDPGNVRVRTRDELEGLMGQARTSGRDLYVHFAHFALAREVFPEIMALLENPETFEQVARLWGLEHQTTRYVYRLRESP